MRRNFEVCNRKSVGGGQDRAGGEGTGWWWVGGQGFTLSFLMILGCRPRTREFRQGADIQGSDAGLPLFIFDATEEQIAGAF